MTEEFGQVLKDLFRIKKLTDLSLQRIDEILIHSSEFDLRLIQEPNTLDLLKSFSKNVELIDTLMTYIHAVEEIVRDKESA
jgi:hypothetical protein